MRAAPLLKRDIPPNLILPDQFSCPCFPTCFTSLAWRRPWNVRAFMFSTCKKRRWRFRKRRFGVHVLTVRYSIRFVYQAWLIWNPLLFHCKVTADVVGCKGGCFSNGSMATMTFLLSLGERKVLMLCPPVPLLSVHLLLQAGKLPRFWEDEDRKKVRPWGVVGQAMARGRSGGSDLVMGLER